MELGPEGVRCWLAAWANGPEAAWHLRNNMRKIVLKVIREQGLFSHLYHTEVHRNLETTRHKK